MDLAATQRELAGLKQSVDELKSELTLALTKISDKLASQSQNYLELRTKVDRLNNVYAVEGDQVDIYGFAEVQNEHNNRNTDTHTAD